MLTVKLKSNSPYISSLMNPKIDSKYEIEGVLTHIDIYDYDMNYSSRISIKSIKDIQKILIRLLSKKLLPENYDITVEWNNYTSNSYKIEDLIVFNDDDNIFNALEELINKRYTFKSIW